MRQCPAWAYAAQRDACFDAGAKQNAPHESEVRGVHPGSAWWVYATKKIPSRLKRKISFLDTQPSFSNILYIV